MSAGWAGHVGRAARFVVVGVANTAVYYACYRLLLLAAPYLAAHLLAWAVAVVFSFFANCHFTYRVRPTWRRFVLFPLTTAVNFAITTVGAVAFVEWWGVADRYATLLAGVIAIPVTFLVTTRVLTGAPSADRILSSHEPLASRPGPTTNPPPGPDGGRAAGPPGVAGSLWGREDLRGAVRRAEREGPDAP